MDPRVGSGRVTILPDFGGSGQHFGFFSFLLIIFLVPESIWIFEYYIRISDWLIFYDIYYIIIKLSINNYSIKECTYGGRVGPRVGSGQTFCSQSRVGSGQRFAGSGRVGSKKSDPWTTLVSHAVRSRNFVSVVSLMHIWSTNFEMNNMVPQLAYLFIIMWKFAIK